MRLLISLLIAAAFLSCRDEAGKPDVSVIKVDLKTSRFEQELFTLDSNHFNVKLDQLIARYPSFGENFLTSILSSDPRWPADTVASYVRGFITSYRGVYDTSQKVFADFTPYEKEIRNGLQYLKFYFPEYKAPGHLITYVGPLDGFGDILSEDAIIVGLHSHLGKNYSAYQTSWLQETYPAYISNRFEPSYISVNSMKNIVLDMYPEKPEDRTLLAQMVEKGKRLYLLSKLLPAKEDYMLIGYTQQQMKDSYAHEPQIWDLFVQNNLLQVNDNNVIKNYIGESPKTQELGDGSPGNIGSFTGWQIVKKYLAQKPKTTLQELMSTDAEVIFRDAKYKP